MTYQVDRTQKYMGSAVQKYQVSGVRCEAFDFVCLIFFFFQVATSSAARDF